MHDDNPETLRLPSGVDEQDPNLLAARLISFGLPPMRSVSSDAEYRRLVALWLGDTNGFRSRVAAIAAGLQLHVADVSHDFGLVIIPSSRQSSFAVRVADVRKRADGPNVGAIAIAYVAVAATFFPTDDLLEDGAHALAQRPSDVVRILGSMIRKHADAAGGNPRGATSWQELEVLPERLDGSKRASMASLEGLVTIVMSDLGQQGLLRESTDGKGLLFHPTHRWRVQVRDATGHELFELCGRLSQSSQDS